MNRVGRWEIVRELGRGAMGVVHEGRSGEERAAIKVLGDADADLIARFRREGRILELLGTHPNIVRFRELGEHAGRPFIAMDLVEGGRTLGDVLKKDPARVPALLVKVARALHFAHEAGVVHRDMKPSNVLMDGEVPRLADFGIARQEGGTRSLTQTGAFIGTVEYAAPEQLEESKHVDRRADVYALGAILYRALAGKLPFSGSGASIMKSILLDEPPPPSSEKSVSPALEALALAALSKDPKKRPQTAEDFARELEAALGISPSSEKPSRRGGLVVAAVLGPTLALALGFVAGRRGRPVEAAPSPPPIASPPAAPPATPTATPSSATHAPVAYATTARPRDALALATEHAKAALVATTPAAVVERADQAWALDLRALEASEVAPRVGAAYLGVALSELRRPDADVASVGIARERLFRARLLLPKEPLPGASEALAAVEKRDVAFRRAARPWRGRAFVNQFDPENLFVLADPRDRTAIPRSHGDFPAWTSFFKKDANGVDRWYQSEELYELLVVWPDRPALLWFLAGMDLSHAGRLDEARRVLTVSRDESPAEILPHVYLARVLRALGRPSEALVEAKVVQQEFRADFWAIIDIVDCLVDEDTAESARSALVLLAKHLPAASNEGQAKTHADLVERAKQRASRP